MTNPQRVDVERQVFAGIPLHEAISLARRYAGSENKLRPRLSQTLESLADALPALLQQLAERDAEIARLNRLADAISRDCNDCANQRNEAMAKAVAAERAREEAEQDRWRTDWPEMKPYTEMQAGMWRSERVIVSLVGGRVTHDVAESFDGKRPLWFIHRDKVRAWQPFPAAFLAANGMAMAPTHSAGGE